MILKPLTPEVEAFCQAIAAGRTIAGGFREAFPERAARVTAHSKKGARILDRPAVRARIAALRAAQLAEPWSCDQAAPDCDRVGAECSGAAAVESEPVSRASIAPVPELSCDAVGAGASDVEAFSAAFPEREARAVRPSELAPPPRASIETAAEIAFDQRRSDLERLIALRAVSAGLSALADHSGAPRIRVAITITVEGAAALRADTACDASEEPRSAR